MDAGLRQNYIRFAKGANRFMADFNISKSKILNSKFPSGVSCRLAS